MEKSIFYIDQHVEVWADRVNVIYDTHTDVYDLVEVQAAELSVERSGWWPIAHISRIGLGLAATVTILLDLDNNRTWEYIPFVLLGGVLVAGILEYIRSMWTLTLQTIYGPANILTSHDEAYLSGVRRAIDKAMKAHDKTLMPA